MEKTQYTRCPSCSTAFKVSQKVLESAQGKVRCGACLTVFQATDYLVKPRKKQSSSGSNISLNNDSDNSLESDPKEQTNHQTDPVLITKDSQSENEVETLPVEAFNEPEIIVGELENLLEKSQDLETIEEIDVENEIDNDAQSIQQKTLEEYLVSEIPHATDPQDSDKQPDTQEVQTSVKPLDNQDSDDLLEDKPSNTNNSDPLSSIELNEVESNELEPYSTETEQNEPDLNSSNLADEEIIEETSSTEDNNDSDETDFNEADVNSIDTLSDGYAEKDTYTEEHNRDLFEEDTYKAEHIDDDEELDQLAHNLTDQIQDTDTQPDPLDEFEGRVRKKKVGLRNSIIAASLLIGLSIISAKFWNNRQQLAWDSTWGNFTHTVCSLLPCALEPRRDIKKIRLRQRIVSPDEIDEDKLDIKLLLVNQAEFDQPYPIINIQFSNSEGKKIANKRILVSEYFPEKAQSLMPSASEVHIGFKIEMPHTSATGFEFSFE